MSSLCCFDCFNNPQKRLIGWYWAISMGNEKYGLFQALVSFLYIFFYLFLQFNYTVASVRVQFCQVDILKFKKDSSTPLRIVCTKARKWFVRLPGFRTLLAIAKQLRVCLKICLCVTTVNFNRLDFWDGLIALAKKFPKFSHSSMAFIVLFDIPIWTWRYMYWEKTKKILFALYPTIHFKPLLKNGMLLARLNPTLGQDRFLGCSYNCMYDGH